MGIAEAAGRAPQASPPRGLSSLPQLPCSILPPDTLFPIAGLNSSGTSPLSSATLSLSHRHLLVPSILKEKTVSKAPFPAGAAILSFSLQPTLWRVVWIAGLQLSPPSSPSSPPPHHSAVSPTAQQRPPPLSGWCHSHSCLINVCLPPARYKHPHVLLVSRPAQLVPRLPNINTVMNTQVSVFGF